MKREGREKKSRRKGKNGRVVEGTEVTRENEVKRRCGRSGKGENRRSGRNDGSDGRVSRLGMSCVMMDRMRGK